jgi:hypothetical protein
MHKQSEMRIGNGLGFMHVLLETEYGKRHVRTVCFDLAMRMQ